MTVEILTNGYVINRAFKSSLYGQSSGTGGVTLAGFVGEDVVRFNANIEETIKGYIENSVSVGGSVNGNGNGIKGEVKDE